MQCVGKRHCGLRNATRFYSFVTRRRRLASIFVSAMLFLPQVERALQALDEEKEFEESVYTEQQESEVRVRERRRAKIVHLAVTRRNHANVALRSV